MPCGGVVSMICYIHKVAAAYRFFIVWYGKIYIIQGPVLKIIDTRKPGFTKVVRNGIKTNAQVQCVISRKMKSTPS